MQIFVDSFDVAEIKRFHELGIIDGVTTNPTLVKNSNGFIYNILDEICKLDLTSISFEVISTDYEGMLKEAHDLKKRFNSRLTIKIPLTPDGLRACKTLRQEGFETNVTLAFSAAQSILAAKCDATFVSIFLGRLEDSGEDPFKPVKEAKEIFRNNQNVKTKILAASIRNVNHILGAFLNGADIVTSPGKVLSEMYNHKLTDVGLERFLNDWAQVKDRISQN